MSKIQTMTNNVFKTNYGYIHWRPKPVGPNQGMKIEINFQLPYEMFNLKKSSVAKFYDVAGPAVNVPLLSA